VTRRIHGVLSGLLLGLALVAAAGWARAGEAAVGANQPSVRIDFFFQAGCGECARIKAELLPELETRYAGFYLLNMRDIAEGGNYALLARYQNRLGVTGNAPVSMVLDGEVYLAGLDEILSGLFPAVDRLLADRLAGKPAPSPDPPPGAGEEKGEGDLMAERARSFTLPAVIGAGLVDGINPCAISTLVFFVSLLSVLQVAGPKLIVVGVSFCAASFVTYTAIGFGMLRFIQLFSGYALMRTAVNVAMIILLAVFAALSFLDAWRYHRSGKAADVTLQLPDKIKLRIHKIMRKGLGTGHLVIGSLLVGSAVTVLESVCTGQVYLPTLVMLIKGGAGDFRNWLYLLLYNLMFQVPIVVVFVLTLKGLKTAELMSLSKRGVTWSKVAMGLFFVTMAALILVL
jgi:hypothetical protein